MRTIELLWSNPWPVSYLYERLKPEDHNRNPIPEMQNYGVYMYLDNVGRVRYVGQAFNKSDLALQKRIRWEIVKDGDGCTESAFYQKCMKYNVDRLNLQVKVAELRNPCCEGSSNEIDCKFMNAIERALIFDRARAGDLLINETGKRRYRLGPIDIINRGNIAPLSGRIVL